VNVEIENHDKVREMLQTIVRRLNYKIEQLEEALKVPRKHFERLDQAQTEEIIEQKDKIIADMSH
jgi:hypothetical protein